MRRLRALLWDVDGTLAETERDGHRVAFNAAFEGCGLPWRWDEARYGDLLAVTGGRERLLHDMDSRPDAPVSNDERESLARRLHELKNAHYARHVRDHGIALRDGVREMVEAGRRRGVAMAIVTTTSRSNVEALLRAAWGERWVDVFSPIVCGEDVTRKKPDPEAHRAALQQLRLAPADVLAIEDAPAGVAAARAAGCPVLVTRSVYFASAPVEAAAAVGPGLHTRAGWQPPARAGTVGRPDWDDLLEWWAGNAGHRPAAA